MRGRFILYAVAVACGASILSWSSISQRATGGLGSGNSWHSSSSGAGYSGGGWANSSGGGHK